MGKWKGIIQNILKENELTIELYDLENELTAKGERIVSLAGGSQMEAEGVGGKVPDFVLSDAEPVEAATGYVALVGDG